MLKDSVILKCAPTMAGLKTGNLFGYPVTDQATLVRELGELNRSLVPRGVRLVLLRYDGSRALLYMYRPSYLRRDMDSPLAREILNQLGYPTESVARCITELKSRLDTGDDFPHEIGLFLGYPAVDVYGFIANKAQCAKCVGTWKVYGDVAEAQKRFRMYKKCTRCYQNSYARFNSFDRLIVAV